MAGDEQLRDEPVTSSDPQDVQERFHSLPGSPAEVLTVAEPVDNAPVAAVGVPMDTSSTPEERAVSIMDQVKAFLAAEENTLKAGTGGGGTLSASAAVTCLSILDSIAGDGAESTPLPFAQEQLSLLVSFLTLLVPASKAASEADGSAAVTSEIVGDVKAESEQVLSPEGQLRALQASWQLVHHHHSKLTTEDITAIFEKSLPWAAEVPWTAAGKTGGDGEGSQSSALASGGEKATAMEVEGDQATAVAVDRELEGRRLVFAAVSELYQEGAPGLTIDHGAMALAAVRKVLHPFTSTAGPLLDNSASSRLYEAVLKCAQLLLDDSNLQRGPKETAGGEGVSGGGASAGDQAGDAEAARNLPGNGDVVVLKRKRESQDGEGRGTADVEPKAGGNPTGTDIKGKAKVVESEAKADEKKPKAALKTTVIVKAKPPGSLPAVSRSQEPRVLINLKTNPTATSTVKPNPNPNSGPKLNSKPNSSPNVSGRQTGAAGLAAGSKAVETGVAREESEDLRLTKLDAVDTRPWLLSKHCAKFFAHEFGVNLVCTAFSKGEPLPKDSVHLRISKRVEGDWKAAEAKWFVTAAADLLRTLGTLGMCSRRLYYEGPYSCVEGDGLPSIKDVAKRISGDDRVNLQRIEEATGAVLKMAQVKVSAEEEKGRGGTGVGAAASGGEKKSEAVWKIIVRVRAVRMPALLAAEEAVSVLLKETAAYISKQVESQTKLAAKAEEVQKVGVKSSATVLIQEGDKAGTSEKASTATPVKASPKPTSKTPSKTAPQTPSKTLAQQPMKALEQSMAETPVMEASGAGKEVKSVGAAVKDKAAAPVREAPDLEAPVPKRIRTSPSPELKTGASEHAAMEADGKDKASAAPQKAGTEGQELEEEEGVKEGIVEKAESNKEGEKDEPIGGQMEDEMKGKVKAEEKKEDEALKMEELKGGLAATSGQEDAKMEEAEDGVEKKMEREKGDAKVEAAKTSTEKLDDVKMEEVKEDKRVAGAEEGNGGLEEENDVTMVETMEEKVKAEEKGDVKMEEVKEEEKKQTKSLEEETKGEEAKEKESKDGGKDVEETRDEEKQLEKDKKETDGKVETKSKEETTEQGVKKETKGKEEDKKEEMKIEEIKDKLAKEVEKASKEEKEKVEGMKEEVKEEETQEEDTPELREAAITEIPTTRTVLVSPAGETKADLSTASLRALFDSVLTERLEIPEGLLDGNQMVLKISPLDSSLAMVELGHEQLAGACLELHKIEPGVFPGLNLEVGPAGERIPVGREIARIILEHLPPGTTVDEVYRVVHHGLYTHATSTERAKARKEGKGRLVVGVRVDEKARLGYVYLPTRQLAERAYAAYEADRRVFNNLRVRKEKPRDMVAGGSNGRARAGGPAAALPAGTLHSGKETKRPEGSAGARARDIDGKAGAVVSNLPDKLDPDFTVYVQNISPSSSASAIGIILRQVLEQHLSTLDLRTAAEPGKIVEEVRKVKPYYALVKLGSQHLVKQALELYRNHPTAYGGLEVKPHRGSRFDREFGAVADAPSRDVGRAAHKPGRGAGAAAGAGAEREAERYAQRHPALSLRGRADVMPDVTPRDYRSYRDHPPSDNHGAMAGSRREATAHRSAHLMSQLDRKYGAPSPSSGVEYYRQEGGGPSRRDGHGGTGGGAYESARFTSGPPPTDLEPVSFGPEMFVQLDRERCIHVTVSRPLEEAFLRRLIEKVLREETGQMSGHFTARFKLLKGGKSGFLELERPELVHILLRAYEREPEPKVRFARMMMRYAVRHA